MISFTLCLLVLVAGYFVYGRLVERIFGPDDRPTPACLHHGSQVRRELFPLDCAG